MSGRLPRIVCLFGQSGAAGIQSSQRSSTSTRVARGLRHRLMIVVSAIAIGSGLAGCGDDSDNGANHKTTTGPNPTQSSTPANEPPSDDPKVLSGAYTVKGPIPITLANPSRFPDKNPHATAPMEGRVGQNVDKLSRALEAARWHFSSDGSVRVSWTDPFVQRKIEMTGTWNVLFNQFDVEVKNPNIMNQTTDGSPNAPLVIRGAMTKQDNSHNLHMSQAQLFYVPPGQPRITGQCSIELKPIRD